MVSFPTYMESAHHYLLDGDTTDGEPSTSGGIIAAINTAKALTPYNLTVPDPATDISSMSSAVSTYSGYVAAINDHTDYDTIYANAIALYDASASPDTYINARVNAHATMLDNELSAKIYPRFEAGMRDINAVQTSAFAIGRALIEMDRNDKVDKFAADMRYQADGKRMDAATNIASEMMRLKLQKLELERVVAAMTIDQLRLKVAINNDYHTEKKAIAADAARWPLETFKYGGNLLAGMSGGTTSSTPMDGNKAARIIASGLSGAVAGSMIGSALGGDSGAGYGTIIGGIAGAIAGA